MKRRLVLSLALLCAASSLFAAEKSSSSAVADRAAVERVYYNHRLGTKQPFEQVLPVAAIEKAVRAELKKEAVLKGVYGVAITDAQVAAEVQRIDSTTRAPETLAEIKAALGKDAARFARTVARPILVERELRARFENDDKTHAPQRRLAERAREAALAAQKEGFTVQLAALREGGAVNEATWLFAPRPAETSPSPHPPGPTTSEKTGSVSYANEAAAQVAQVLSSPEPGREDAERKSYFEDLPGELQQVLRAQLRQLGDVSAVIEGPRAFQLYLARERTAAALSAAVLTLPKRSYEDWLAQQPEP